MKKILTLIALAATLSLTSCNTVSGIGQDIQKGGAALEKSANN